MKDRTSTPTAAASSDQLDAGDSSENLADERCPSWCREQHTEMELVTWDGRLHMSPTERMTAGELTIQVSIDQYDSASDDQRSTGPVVTLASGTERIGDGDRYTAEEARQLAGLLLGAAKSIDIDEHAMVVDQLLQAGAQISFSDDEKCAPAFGAIVQICALNIDVVLVLFRYPEDGHVAIIADNTRALPVLTDNLRTALAAVRDPDSFPWTKDGRFYGFALGVIGHPVARIEESSS